MTNAEQRKGRLRTKVLLTGLLFSLCSGCIDPCANDEVVRVASPDSKLEAVVFQRDCGATTDFSTQISIIPMGASLSKASGRPLFVADTDHGKAPSASWGGPPADVEWLDKRKLKVVTHPDARVFRKDSAVTISTGILSKEAVTVEYVLKGP